MDAVTGEQEIISLFDGEKIFEDAEIKERVLKVWNKVFQASNSVINHANNYGFSGMEIIPCPNIHEMIFALKILSSVFEILVTSAEKLDVNYDEIRLMLNAKEQITRMERMAAALKANNRTDFDKALTDLEAQATF